MVKTFLSTPRLIRSKAPHAANRAPFAPASARQRVPSIGGLAGGGKGAAIGSLAGGGAGAGFQLATHGQQVKIPSETQLAFQLESPLTVTVQRQPRPAAQ